MSQNSWPITFKKASMSFSRELAEIQTSNHAAASYSEVSVTSGGYKGQVNETDVPHAYCWCCRSEAPGSTWRVVVPCAGWSGPWAADPDSRSPCSLRFGSSSSPSRCTSDSTPGNRQVNGKVFTLVLRKRVPIDSSDIQRHCYQRVVSLVSHRMGRSHYLLFCILRWINTY